MGKPRKDQPLNKPYYKGGNEALKKFISDQLKYPQDALEHKIEGFVVATYDVDDLGRVKNIKIRESLGYGCDEEVIRLVGLLKYEKAYNKGRNVAIHRKIKVDFKLPESNQPKQQKVSYKVIPSSPKKKEPKTKAPSTISYTIKF